MNYEAFFATLVVYIGTLLVTGILFFFKGYRDGIKEREEYVKKYDLLKKLEDEESEDTE